MLYWYNINERFNGIMMKIIIIMQQRILSLGVSEFFTVKYNLVFCTTKRNQIGHLSGTNGAPYFDCPLSSLST